MRPFVALLRSGMPEVGDGERATRRRYRSGVSSSHFSVGSFQGSFMPGQSSFRFDAIKFPISFVVIVLVVIDGAEEVENFQLPAALDVLLERGGDGGFLGRVVADLAGRFDQSVVDGKIGGHRASSDV
uniref:Uncharacterized protein n=1 Tax=mine drainage metagenome TaxID=410659 RepID=E6QI88_9ZZZZ